MDHLRHQDGLNQEPVVTMADPARTKQSSLLANTVDIHQWLAADTQTAYQERVQRDHGFAQQLAPDEAGGLADNVTVLKWWSQIGAHADSSTGHKLTSVIRLVSVGLLLAGLFVGASTTSLALAYTGDYPVNLLSLFAILLGIPWIFLILTAITGSLSAVGISAGLRLPVGIKRPLLAWLDRVSGTSFRHALGHGDTSGKVAYWIFLKISQWFTVGFFVASIVTSAAMVTFSDLAFGWSTTLVVDPRTIHAAFNVLAWPWQNWFPAASPSLELVELSQFFRAQSIGERARVLGLWWPFVIMCLLVWGLLPRAVLLLIATVRLRRLTVRYLLDHPEVAALLDRIHNPSIAFTHADLTGSSRPQSNAPDRPAPRANESAIDVSWNGAAAGEHITQLTAAMTAAERKHCIHQIREQVRSSDRQSIRIFTKGWEPPMLDFMDCVRELQDEISIHSIQIVPLPLTAGNEGNETVANDTEQWHQAVTRAGIPGVYVLPPRSPVKGEST